MCGHLGNPKYDMYCTTCFANLFKDDPRTQNIHLKSKEILWVNKIMTELPLTGWIWDKAIYVDFYGGCCPSKRRIDLRALVDHPQAGLFWLCIEIDENQHKQYAANYEEDRYNDLFMDFSGRYVFLRVNPDPFRLGSQRLNPSLEERFGDVKTKILSVLTNGPETQELVEIHHFFYGS